jgi:isocitrate dehydrogenase kinase/phosphatase
VATITVEQVPEALLSQLEQRATEEHTTVSAIVVRALWRELSRSPVQAWLDLVAASSPTKATEESIVRSIRESRESP